MLGEASVVYRLIDLLFGQISAVLCKYRNPKPRGETLETSVILYPATIRDIESILVNFRNDFNNGQLFFIEYKLSSFPAAVCECLARQDDVSRVETMEEKNELRVLCLVPLGGSADPSAETIPLA